MWKFYLADPDDSALVHHSTEFGEQFRHANQHHSGCEIVDRPLNADIIVLFEEWSLKLQSYADVLGRCPFLQEHAARILVVNYDDAGTAFLPGCYTSLTPRTFDPRLHRPSCYPKAYNPFVESIAQRPRQHEPRWLCTFRGNTRQQRVRRRVLEQLCSEPGFRITDPGITFHCHDECSQIEYLEEIADSEFVLCPRGESPSTYRMFEVMQMGRCPVILSDDWQPIPGIDWNSCSIRVPERDVRLVPRILAARHEDARELGRRARSIWEQFFEDRAKYRLFAAQLAELHALRCTHGTDDLHALRRRWSSHEFRWQRTWTLPQRLLRAPRRAARILQSWTARPELTQNASQPTEQRT